VHLHSAEQQIDKCLARALMALRPAEHTRVEKVSVGGAEVDEPRARQRLLAERAMQVGEKPAQINAWMMSWDIRWRSHMGHCYEMRMHEPEEMGTWTAE
jgi:hypothetical protein